MVSSPSLQRPLTRSLRMYQRIALAFVGLTFLMLFVVLYLSVSRANITVFAKPTSVSTTATLEVVTQPLSDGQIAGFVAKKTLTRERYFSLPQEGARAIEGKSTGTVVVKNTTNSPQPLVATTRFLAQNGVLFRLKDNVTVPAQGEISVIVVADVAGSSGDIAATTFTIPGLATSLQSLIYGVSQEAFHGGVQYVRTLSEQDVHDATLALREEILAAGKQELQQGVSAELVNQGTYDIHEVSSTTDVALGSEAGGFTLSMTADVTGVFYDTNLVGSYAKSLLQKRIPEGFLLERLSDQGVQTSIASVDTQKGEAELSVYLEGEALISEDAPTLAKERFIGRAPHEVFTLLRSSDAVADVAITFTPFWLQRVPTLEDHISIEIKEQEQGGGDPQGEETAP